MNAKMDVHQPASRFTLGFATQDSISLHPLSTCVILYGRWDDLGNLGNCSSHTVVELAVQIKGRMSNP